MKTNLHKLIEDTSTHPSLMDSKLEAFIRPADEVIIKQHYEPCTTVNLSQVVGVQHPDYSGSTWGELLGNPLKNITPRLKRINRGLKELHQNPDYYLNNKQKKNWSFYLINGKYYVQVGVHRTIIGYFFLEYNQRPPIISGVAVTEVTVSMLSAPTPKSSRLNLGSILNAMKKKF